ncbi:ABC transporter substrate-binding protein [Micromonospora sp. RTGN7]|uniref:ABC transporter substrate-binding protein n=1 Tax=Micromonospora sp. RTGN7 TaxID=3016526 RepID=UPI0029FF323B|nr:ABC transporter substrate-binding protein [Micromonospora sp. RTGN7]
MATPASGPATLDRRKVLAAAAGTLLLTACGRTGAEDGGPTGGATTLGGQDLVLGVSLELTGAGAALGVLQERALRISLESLNADGVPVGNLRRTVRLEVRDNASDPRLAARQVTELIRRDGVHALLGGTLAETSAAIVDVAQQLMTPYVSLAHGDGIVLPLAQRTYIYKLTPDAADVARRLARLIASQGRKRVVVLAADGLHGNSGVRTMSAALRAVDLKPGTIVRLPRTEESFFPAAQRVTAAKPDAVVIWGTAPDTGAAARTLRQAGHAGPLYLDAGGVAEDTLDDTNATALEGAYAVHPICLGGSTLTNTTTAALARRDFVYRYIQRHGGFSGFAPYASDALQLLANAARRAASVDRGRLRAYLQTQIIEGIAGAYSFAPIRHGGMDRNSLGIYRVDHGGWVRVS